jgi:hypothetical protein
VGSRVTTININTVEPAGATLTIGESGDTVKVNDSVNVNTVKDAGGNTLWVSNGSGVLSSVSGFGDSLVLLSTQTASSSANISFSSGIDSTYKEYVFKFIDIHPATNNANFSFQVNPVGGSGFNQTITSTAFYVQHTESDSAAEIGYSGDVDQAEGTAYQPVIPYIGNGSDVCGVGKLQLFEPSSTTYVKNFIITSCTYDNGDTCMQYYIAGYINTTSAIDEIDFKFSSGNTDAGTIKMYGVK